MTHEYSNPHEKGGCYAEFVRWAGESANAEKIWSRSDTDEKLRAILVRAIESPGETDQQHLHPLHPLHPLHAATSKTARCSVHASGP